MIIDDLKLEKCIGKGIFGDVYLTSKKKSQIKYATKRIDKKLMKIGKLKEYFENAQNILSKINHKNILQIIEIKENTKYIFLVKKYCNGGSLRQCLQRYQEEFDKPFSQEIIQHIMKQIIDIIKYIHSLNIIHRNLTLDNILVEFENKEYMQKLNMLKTQIKLNDFLFATEKKTMLHQSVIGRPSNMDPIILEIIKSKGKPKIDLGYDEKVDIWSIGSICYELLLGKELFNTNNLSSHIQDVDKGIYTLPYNISNEMLSFLNKMLQYDNALRDSAEELSKDDFLTKNVNDFKPIDFNTFRKQIDSNGLKINFKKQNETIIEDEQSEDENKNTNFFKLGQEYIEDSDEEEKKKNYK
jgi:serine/threonine protein kinase